MTFPLVSCRICLPYLVQVYVIGVIHDRRGVLGKQLAHHGAVGLAVDVRHGVLQHLVKLRILHLWWRQQFALQQLLGGGPQGRVMVQQPLYHFPLTDTKRRHGERFCSVTTEPNRGKKLKSNAVLTCLTCSFVLKFSGKMMGSCSVKKKMR